MLFTAAESYQQTISLKLSENLVYQQSRLQRKGLEYESKEHFLLKQNPLRIIFRMETVQYQQNTRAHYGTRYSQFLRKTAPEA